MAAREHFVTSGSKASLARQIGISRQALYYRPRRPTKDEVCREQILKVMADHPAYGHRRIALTLKMNKKRILRVMQLYHIRPVILRRGKYPRFSKEIVASAIPNRLKDVTVTRPHYVWVGDFTHLWFHGRYLYLATVMDYCTREIIAWQMGFHHTSRLVVDVLDEAFRKRKTSPEFFHSDQGSEYTSQQCMSWLIRHGVTASNSPKGKPWHNGRQESFYSSFKLEFGKPARYATLELLIEALGRHIHYYNTRRIHSSLKMPPREFYERNIVRAETKKPRESGS